MKDRIKAFSIHIVISITFICACAGFTILHFYPGLFFNIEDTSDILRILIPADIIIGPLLTFVIYVKGKRGLKFDLIVIALCQIIAMSYGCWSLYQARPGFLVFHGDGFYIVPPRIDQKNIQPNLYVGAFNSPKMASVLIPGNAAQRYKIAIESAGEGIPIHWQAQYYQPLSIINKAAYEKATINMQKLKANIKNPSADELAAIDIAMHLEKTHYLIPVVGTRSSQIITVNKLSLAPEKVLKIFPF